MEYGFFRVACASPRLKIADCKHNADEIVKLLKRAEKDGAECTVFPELSITGATCADLFFQTNLIHSVCRTLTELAERTKDCPILYAVGAPLLSGGALFNCAVFIYRGRILAAVPKTHIGGRSFYNERRYFTCGSAAAPGFPAGHGQVISIGSHTGIPFGTDILIRMSCGTSGINGSGERDIYIGVLIGEDVYGAGISALQSRVYAHAGLTAAHIILNPAAEPFIVGSAKRKACALCALSERCASVCVCANAGSGESATDFVFRAHNGIFENGTVLAQSDFRADFRANGNGRNNDKTGALGEADGYLVQDVDIELLENERLRRSAEYGRLSASQIPNMHIIEAAAPEPANGTDKDVQNRKNKTAVKQGLKRHISRLPFVPENPAERKERCEEVLSIQASGLAERLKNTGIKKAVIGLSGGLDSTLALLAAVDAFKICGLSPSAIHAFSMPCFGTSSRTKNNAERLASVLGVSFKEIDIQTAVRAHLNDIGASEDVHDSVYENAQARERTQILMDSANKTGGLVIGTGDLSESALGWSTYNGDHMSMYNVNASIPKTLARELVLYAAELAAAKLAAILTDIVQTPVSPELLPAENGHIAQKTEDILGPYELHDFFLYYVVRRNFSPRKILFLAECAFQGEYKAGYIKEKLALFYRRFFTNQFKRSCMSDGISVGTVSLSPRTSFSMPSDAQASLWLKELENPT
ncbi:NAD(+) synthase [Treponema sp. OMZ 840]|uniref:NAD(+) synthase n=1 Tax=Treponema sp. OMZ 840 TaxID=244313 RepID=UPI003D8F8B68